MNDHHMLKNRSFIFRFILLLLALFVVLMAAVYIRNFQIRNDEKQVIAGGVFVGERSDKGWNESHYYGILSACSEHSCTFIAKENIPEGDSSVQRAVKELADKGCSVIFLTSFGYSQYLDELASTYPDIAFFSVAGEDNSDNCTTYFARMYQARYLAGIVAGAQSETGILGMVVAMPIPEVYRAINAYCMGARKSNPEAKVRVIFTGSWDDEEAEKAAAKELCQSGADVITYHTDRPYAIDEAEDIGVYSTGYESVFQEYSENFLTAAVVNWDVLYVRVLGDFLSGRTDFSRRYWLDISDGVVSLYPYSPLVGDDAKKLVESESWRIQTWRDVFSGEIYDNAGHLRCEKDESISDEELFERMDWLVDGVEVYGQDQ